MAINWKAFYANGGYSNENSDPLSYDDGEDDDENERCVRRDCKSLRTKNPHKHSAGITNPCEQVVTEEDN